MTCLNQCLSLVCLSPLGYVCKSLVCLITCLLVQRTRFLEGVGKHMVADAITTWSRRSGIHHCIVFLSLVCLSPQGYAGE